MATPENFDPFDAENLRLSQDFAAELGVRKVLTTIQVRKPDRQWFVRTHPDESMRPVGQLLELKDAGETYWCTPAIAHELAEEITRKWLVLSVSRQGTLFFWPIKMPDATGLVDQWNSSAAQAANRARDEWVRVSANRQAACYDLWVAAGDIPEPEWDKLTEGKTVNELLRIAFRDRVIDKPDHPVLLQLRGAA